MPSLSEYIEALDQPDVPAPLPPPIGWDEVATLEGGVDADAATGAAYAQALPVVLDQMRTETASGLHESDSTHVRHR